MTAYVQEASNIMEDLTLEDQLLVIKFIKIIKKLCKNQDNNIKSSVESFIGSGVFPPEYNDPNYDPDYELLRESHYKEEGLL